MSVVLDNYKIMLCPHCCSVVAFDINEDIIAYSKEFYNWETFEEVYINEGQAECPNCHKIVTTSTETKRKPREELIALRNLKGGNTDG
jgi:hypothetical protein